MDDWKLEAVPVVILERFVKYSNWAICWQSCYGLDNS